MYLQIHQRFYQILAIQGYVGVSTMALPAPPTDGAPAVASLSLISRLGWKRAGTRFNTRGVDDDGNTANFVEVCHPKYSQLSLFIFVFRQKQYLVQTSIALVMYRCAEVFLVSDWNWLVSISFIEISQFSGNNKACRLLGSASKLPDPMLPNLPLSDTSSNLWKSMVQYMLSTSLDKRKMKRP